MPSSTPGSLQAEYKIQTHRHGSRLGVQGDGITDEQCSPSLGWGTKSQLKTGFCRKPVPILFFLNRAKANVNLWHLPAS